MGKPRAFFKKLATGTKTHSPIILLAAGLAAGISAVVVAIKQTSEAKEIIDAETQKKIYETGDPEAKLTKGETFKLVWKKYIPVATLVVVFLLSILSSAGIVHRRYESVAAELGLLSVTSSEYADKVIETIGKKKEQDIRDSIVADKIEKAKNVEPSNAADATPDKTLFLDTLTGAKFYATYEYIRGVVNDLNEELIKYPEWYVTVDDWCDKLPNVSADNMKVAKLLAWQFDTGLLNIHFVHMMDEDKVTPIIGIEHHVLPKQLPY